MTGEVTQASLAPQDDVALGLELGPPARGTLRVGSKVAAVFVSAGWRDVVESACAYLRGAGLDVAARGLAAEYRKRVEL